MLFRSSRLSADPPDHRLTVAHSQQLTPRERSRVIELLVEQVEYDGSSSRVEVSFRAAGIKTLAEELDSRLEVA